MRRVVSCAAESWHASRIVARTPRVVMYATFILRPLPSVAILLSLRLRLRLRLRLISRCGLVCVVYRVSCVLCRVLLLLLLLLLFLFLFLFVVVAVVVVAVAVLYLVVDPVAVAGSHASDDDERE